MAERRNPTRADLLDQGVWEAISTPPAACDGPSSLPVSGWLPAVVPGTAAAVLRAAGRWSWDEPDRDLLDGADWWWRGRFEAPAGPVRLRADGIATLSTIWVDGVEVAAGRSMWRRIAAEVDLDGRGEHEVVVRAAALELPAGRRPRARWRSRLAPDSEVRWLRTAIGARTPVDGAGAAPVGPWRPLRLLVGPAGPFDDARVQARAVDGGGVVEVVTPPVVGARLAVRAGGTTVEVGADGRASVWLPGAARWWPHTHGRPDLHDVELLADGEVVAVRRVGVRTVTFVGDGFEVNGVPVFCRGAVYDLPDQVGLDGSAESLLPGLVAARDAGANLLRVSGVGVYPPPAFWDLCDELGLLVWLDAMLAGYDPPGDPDWEAEVAGEVAEVLSDAACHPALALLCGSNEMLQQAAMLGLPRERATSDLLEVALAGVAADAGVGYVPSSPVGGWPPFDPAVGVAHYFGVGAYLRPLDDATVSGVRFATECLAFSTPPEPATVAGVGGPAAWATPAWRLGVPRDPGADWDFGDVTAHYAERFFGIDLDALCRADPARGLHAARAAVCEAVEGCYARWRRPSSGCNGALVLTWSDRRPGAGWGLLDVTGRPKAPWWVLRRMWAPLGLWCSDDGLSGLRVHVVNDRATPLEGEVVLAAVSAQGHVVVDGRAAVHLGPHSAASWADAELTGVFRDLTTAYRFGDPAHVGVYVTLTGPDGPLAAPVTYLPPATPRLDDPGLAAAVVADADGWAVELSCASVAAWVALDVPGFVAADHWFHLLPGVPRRVALTPGDDAPDVPAGSARALGSAAASPLRAP